MMTKKDFEMIAEVLHDTLNSPTGIVVRAFGEMLEGQNPRFDRQRFEDAAFFGKKR